MEILVAIVSFVGSAFWFRSATLRLPKSTVWDPEDRYHEKIAQIHRTNAWAAGLTGCASLLQFIIAVLSQWHA